MSIMVFIGLFEFIGFFGFFGFVEFVGFVGFIGFVGFKMDAGKLGGIKPHQLFSFHSLS